jgi:hypothetical protein
MMLTGFNTPTFGRGIKALDDVIQLFDRHIQENKLDECTIVNKCGDHLGIHLTNQYLTPRRESMNEPNIPFEPHVDPSGILASLVGAHIFMATKT